MSDERTVEQLVADLGTDTGLDFFETYETLKQRSDKQAVQPLIKMIDEVIDDDIRFDTLDYIVDILFSLRDERAIEPIVNVLHRLESMTAFGLIVFETRATPFLVRALTSEHHVARFNAAYLLYHPRFYNETIVEPLIAVTQDKDEHFGIRTQAIWSLGKIGDKRAFEPLLSLLTDENDRVRDMARKSVDTIQANSQ
jgi:HEAT repeat protein